MESQHTHTKKKQPPGDFRLREAKVVGIMLPQVTTFLQHNGPGLH